jgi:hypothetical protein
VGGVFAVTNARPRGEGFLERRAWAIDRGKRSIASVRRTAISSFSGRARFRKGASMLDPAAKFAECPRASAQK